MAAEPCAGCDRVSELWPWVAIVHDGEGFVAVPVCNDCHKTPANRKRILKAHFFPRSQRARALALAGSSDLA